MAARTCSDTSAPSSRPDAADQSVIFVENQAGGIYLEKPNEVRDCTLKFDYLRAEACDTKVSATMIAGLVKEIP
ncbi:Scr1 family TA system antitoxin-like transcriptional regulator [Micromonospora sp. KC213]|uniref:Scr1 family TA system antitoxin-like transcriptional regulator n=1 Tax=Micromonospora sp. KC213 TaxID=2530378 RepID=UPI00104F1DC3|nr:Scr1 family TA system antitoxin-like transcriptional regulator [Micromonospora sp. KC213]TDC41083.1 hypothetical protein E1166_12965 [Micromonospora sp. KC213]